MDTCPKPHRFIILIPHRDALRLFSEFRQYLFSIGFLGAYAFPLSSPLAELSAPFSREELKELAANIRILSGKTDGKILCGKTTANPGLGEFSFFGPVLDIPIGDGSFPPSAKDKIINTLLPPLLCTALVDRGENSGDKRAEGIPAQEAPALSFRAAALANLAIRPLGEGARFSFEWRMSPLTWLPAHK